MKLPLLVTISLLSFGCSRENPETAANSKNKKECAERAQAYLRHERIIDTPSNGINGSVRNEQYTYSNSLNTCLLYFEVAEVGAGASYNIVDTLANKNIYYQVSYSDPSEQQKFDTLCKRSEVCLDRNEFEKKRAELLADLR
jgi:hypothetical protein